MISAQVVNFNTKPYLRPCLESLLAALELTPGPHSIAVLENGSGDDLDDLAAEFAGRVDFHASDVNRGFGGGHNHLAALTDSEFLCFVNPDLIATQRDVFNRLLTAFDHDRVAVAGPLLRTSEGAPQRWDHGELRGPRARIANGAGHAHWRPRTAATEAAWVSGAFMLIRRDAFDAAGGFDERFFLYKEDEDLCLQVRRNGGKVIYVPEAEATHVGSVVAGRDPQQLERSNRAFWEKNHPARRRRAVEWAYLNVTRRL